MRTHNNPKQWDQIKTFELIASLGQFPSIAAKWKELELAGWKLFVCGQKRGWCDCRTKWIVIPVWCFGRDDSYWAQYVSHEFAHAIDLRQYYKEQPHGAEFMERMKSICPKELWHLELEYKPRNGKTAGIEKVNAVKVGSKIIDLFDLL